MPSQPKGQVVRGVDEVNSGVRQLHQQQNTVRLDRISRKLARLNRVSRHRPPTAQYPTPRVTLW